MIKDMKNISENDWNKDLEKFFCYSKNEAITKGIPLHGLGYSLGALLLTNLIKKNETPHKFEKLLFFAPAIKIHGFLNLFRPLTYLSDSFMVPSRSVKEYIAEKGTSLSAYRSFFKSQSEVDWKGIQENFPQTLVLMDPNDELIDYEGLNKKINNAPLPKLKMETINTKGSTTSKKYAHLIIDNKCMADKEWERVSQLIQNFLKI